MAAKIIDKTEICRTYFRDTVVGEYFKCCGHIYVRISSYDTPDVDADDDNGEDNVFDFNAGTTDCLEEYDEVVKVNLEITVVLPQ